MKAKFVGEEIEVPEKRPGAPASFVWRGKEYKVAKVESSQRVLDFQKSWWRRRHRDYYVVRAENGQVFKIYRHRGPGRRYWVLFEIIEE